uniref:Uncharacterized protein n=1 Tax=Lactuca sativa TaxID=4236 RepID=A0A9R1UVY9_LACSA|nr:hypothetical protein LSAT_V11C800445770 [Lactuca sativa]
MKIKNVPSHDILSTLKRQNSKNVSTIKTVYNECYKFQMNDLGDRSQMQVVFGFLHSKAYIFNHRANDTTNALEDLFFVHPTTLEIWRAFPMSTLLINHLARTHFENLQCPAHNVKGGGNFGFRSIAIALGRSEHDWLQIRCDQYNDLLSHYQEYVMIYGDVDFVNRISHTLNYSGLGFAVLEYWLVMPDTGILIANRYGVIVIYISKQGSSTWFLHRYDP